MISWLLDLIFSNLWLLLLVFWLFRSFARGARQGREDDSSDSPLPADFPWETEKEPVIKRRPADPLGVSPSIERASPPFEGEGEAPARAVKRAKQQAARTLPQEEAPLPPAVQGMIWSQIYGPPRSKMPHRIGRKSR